MDGRYYQVMEKLSSERKANKENILFLMFLSPTLRSFIVFEFCIKYYVRFQRTLTESTCHVNKEVGHD